MFRSFFPNPTNFFISAIAWTAVAMTLWFTAGSHLEPYLSLGPWLGIQPTEANPAPFFNSGKVWLYEYVLAAGYLFCIPWYFLNDNRRWYWWSVVGSVTIIEVVYFNVQVDAWLNDWYGGFYDLIQTALARPTPSRSTSMSARSGPSRRCWRSTSSFWSSTPSSMRTICSAGAGR